MTLPLPTTITPGDPGHVGDHEDIGLLFAAFVSGDKVAGFKSGTYAAIPAAGNFPRVYYATDIGMVFLDTGAAWTCVGHRFIGAKGIKSAGQSITTATVTDLNFDGTEEYDTDTLHSTGAGVNHLWTVPAGWPTGKWAFGGSISFADNSTGYRQVLAYANGVATSFLVPSAIAGADTFVGFYIEAELAATQSFKVAAKQTSGGNLNIQAGSGQSVAFMKFLGAA